MTPEQLGAWIAFGTVWSLLMAYGLSWMVAAGWNHGVQWSLDSIRRQRKERRSAEPNMLPFKPKREE